MKNILKILMFGMILSCANTHAKEINRRSATGKATEKPKSDSSDDAESEHSHDDLGNNSGTVKYSLFAKFVNEKCGICHKPNGSRSFSDLTSFEGFKKWAEQSAIKVENGHNESTTKLTDEEKKLFIDLKTKTLENDLNSNVSDQITSNLVEFRIKSGTGAKAWNSSSQPLELKIGQTLRVHNDDNEIHALHTNGVPCEHGEDIEPGKYWDCKLESIFDDGKLYDHYNQQAGFFYFSVRP